MLNVMEQMNGAVCACGRIHKFTSKIHRGTGAIGHLAGSLLEQGTKKAFVLCDKNTYGVAGQLVEDSLRGAAIPYQLYIYAQSPEPDEKHVGAAIMHCPPDCDTVVGIGSGVINDIGKILCAAGNKTYAIVATAPSMDGYASASSSVTRAGLKISLPTKSADIIIGDTRIFKTAPQKMILSGLGDMIAKYISICEWRLSHLITGEYYCEKIAALVKGALALCIQNADRLLKKEDDAIEAVFDGLLIGSVAMNYAGLSRPASGTEHYISHILDMRGEAFGTPVELHGIQCAVGTLITARLYESLKSVTPDRARALAYAKNFDINGWNKKLRALLGAGAESMIELEQKERKYDLKKHGERLEIILEHWDEIIKIVDEEIPSPAELEALYDRLSMPKLTDGTQKELLPDILRATKDIRDKYVLSRLLWDLGLLDAFAESARS